MDKKGIDFSFGWIFALIVGAVIIFLAIYAATSLVNQQKIVVNSESAKQLGTLLNPIETSLESGKITYIELPLLTRIFNACDSSGNFGSQQISLTESSGVGGKWSSQGVPSNFYNKYVFSSSTIEGKKVIALSKPFKMPYAAAQAVYLWSDEEHYCFVNAPNQITNELSDLQPQNINLTFDVANCPKNSTKVCFDKSGCDIDVNLNSKSVKKQGQPTVFYTDDSENALIYGAIFSDPGAYECEVRRLMKRTSQLADIYLQKSLMISNLGCKSGLEDELSIYANATLSLNSSLYLANIRDMSDELGRRNAQLSCNLFDTS